nr:small nuclear ribonucleoprotein SmD3b-like [Tanacetum cinerariifolium]
MSRSLGIPVKLLHEAAGHIVTVELKSGEVYRGSMIECEDNWNCQLENITFTAKDGKVTQLEHVFIRGSKVRFMIIPDMLKNAPMFKRLEARIKGKGSALGVGRGRAVAMRARAQAAGRGTAGPGRGRVTILVVMQRQGDVIFYMQHEIDFVPSCNVIFDLEPLLLSFDFVFSFEIFKSFLVVDELDRSNPHTIESSFDGDRYFLL